MLPYDFFPPKLLMLLQDTYINDTFLASALLCRHEASEVWERVTVC